jgi:hypothetical protein
MVNEPHHPGPIPIERAVKLAGALAESGVATLHLLDGLGIPAEAAASRRLQARETDLPGELVRAGSAWTLRNDDRSLVVEWDRGQLRVIRDESAALRRSTN